jgi:hypothetical protein
MSKRQYTVQFNGVAVTAQQDFFEIVGATTKLTKLKRVILSQTTDVGDAQEEGLLILIKSGQTTSGTGGTAPAVEQLDAGDGVESATAEANNTTKASAGTIVTHHPESWNVRAPFEWPRDPDVEGIPLGNGRRATVELATTPVDSITISGVAYLEEEG